MVINITSVNKKEAIKRLDKALNQTKTNASSYYFKPSENEKWKQFIASYESVMEAVANDADVVKDISIYFLGSGKTASVGKIKQALRDLSNFKRMEIS